MEHRILELLRPDDSGYCYAEGNSPTVMLLEPNRRTIDPDDVNGWFCFEESWVDTCVILSRDMRFTATQILEAVEDRPPTEADERAELQDRNSSEDMYYKEVWGR